MKTVGEILKTGREKKNITLERVSVETKIKKKFLENIENNNFRVFPSEVVIRGFIKNYAEFLGLSTNLVLAVFKRDFHGDCQENISSKKEKKLIAPLEFCWSPRLTLVTSIVIAFLTLVTYLGFQYFSLVRNPRLEVLYPPENQEVSSEEIEVTGETDADVTVMVNGEIASIVNSKFSLPVTLLPGENKIITEAFNKLGKKTTVVRTVFQTSREE
jgi:cytoskeletal protein RodZ